MTKFIKLVSVIKVGIALFYASTVGAFIVAQFALPVTSFWLIYAMGYTFISVLLKIAAEAIIAIINFISIFFE